MLTAKLDLAEELVDQLNSRTIFTIPGTNISFDESTVVQWIIMAAVTIISIIFVRGFKVDGKISKRQLVVEALYEKLRNFYLNAVGERGEKYVPWIMTVAIFVGACNMMGIFGLKPPTKTLNTTAALGIMSILLVQFVSIKENGVKGWVKSFAKPVAIVLPINLLELIIKPLSLCMRLFGNILGAFVIMELVKAVVPMVVPVALSLYFDIFDALIQVYVFTFLTSIYVREALE